MTRIVLRSHTVDGPDQAVAGGALALSLFDDFSVGPLADWRDPVRFRSTRADFWATAPHAGWEIGVTPDPPLWFQFHPPVRASHLPAEGALDGDPIDDLPLLDHADAIFELWSDATLRGQVMLWYAVAELTRAGVGLDRLRHCALPDLVATPFDGRFWRRMLTDAPDRDFPAVAIPPATRDRMLRCWAAVVARPARVPDDLAQDPVTGPVFRHLVGRAPDPATGLTNLQTRLVRATPDDWTRMARVIADAMGAGYEVGDRVGDRILCAELRALTRDQSALVELSGPGQMFNTQVRLTEIGRRRRALLPEP